MQGELDLNKAYYERTVACIDNYTNVVAQEIKELRRRVALQDKVIRQHFQQIRLLDDALQKSLVRETQERQVAFEFAQYGG